MPTNDDEVQHECTYVGDHERGMQGRLADRPLPPTPGLAKAIALEVFEGKKGKIHPTEHFRKRTVDRDFDIFDVEYIVRNGLCLGQGEYCPVFKNHKYKFRGDIDGTEFDAVFALAADHDLIRSPLVVLVTGCFRTRTGKRKRTF